METLGGDVENEQHGTLRGAARAVSTLRELEDIPSAFEDGLVRHLQPIRGYYLALALQALFDINLAQDLLSDGPQPLHALAGKFGLEKSRLEGLLFFLQREGYVQQGAHGFTASNRLREFARYWPWYDMLIGGYGQTIAKLSDALKAGSPSLPRDNLRVSRGSCGISHYDAIPITKALLRRLPRPAKKLVDLGCGNARYLAEFRDDFPALELIGVEPAPDSFADAVGLVQNISCASGIRLINEGAVEFLSTSEEQDVDVFVLGFVLHEILAQQERGGVVDFLGKITSRYPHAHVIVIEVDPLVEQYQAQEHPLFLGYYNPYFLLHHITRQRLESADFWRQLFADAGFKILAEQGPDQRVDSTGLELGFLVGPS